MSNQTNQLSLSPMAKERIQRAARQILSFNKVYDYQKAWEIALFRFRWATLVQQRDITFFYYKGDTGDQERFAIAKKGHTYAMDPKNPLVISYFDGDKAEKRSFRIDRFYLMFKGGNLVAPDLCPTPDDKLVEVCALTGEVFITNLYHVQFNDTQPKAKPVSKVIELDSPFARMMATNDLTPLLRKSM